MSFFRAKGVYGHLSVSRDYRGDAPFHLLAGIEISVDGYITGANDGPGKVSDGGERLSLLGVRCPFGCTALARTGTDVRLEPGGYAFPHSRGMGGVGRRGRITFIAAVLSFVLAVPASAATNRASIIQQNSGGTSTANGSVRKPTAAVSLGDSYISGEAGRWQGNSINPVGSRDGTDRAFTGTGYDKSRVYLPPSDRNGCHRSDVAEIRSARLPVEEKINISCSGAVTRNIFRSSNGGQGQNGERPQADQLAALARRTRVRLIVLSIGGNDLGFASIVSSCLQAYATLSPPCERSQQPMINDKMPTTRANIGKAISEIRAAMRSAGYRQGSYRLIFQSYPSAIARGSELRVPEIDRNRRTNVDGCPVYNSDATWARDSVVHQISNNWRAVATDKGVQFLDLRHLLQGREMCSKFTRLATPLKPPSPTTSDWARFLNVAAVESQGDLQETFHPNAYGQRAFGKCLSLIYAQTGNGSCRNRAGSGPRGVVIRSSG